MAGEERRDEPATAAVDVVHALLDGELAVCTGDKVAPAEQMTERVPGRDVGHQILDLPGQMRDRLSTVAITIHTRWRRSVLRTHRSIWRPLVAWEACRHAPHLLKATAQRLRLHPTHSAAIAPPGLPLVILFVRATGPVASQQRVGVRRWRLQWRQFVWG